MCSLEVIRQTRSGKRILPSPATNDWEICLNSAMSNKTTTRLQQITQVLASYPAVEAAYLFGSHARGQANAHSDIDLALVGPATQLHAIKLDLLADLVAAGLDRVDLVLLNGADLTLRFEAVSPNCLVYAKEDFDGGSYFSRTVREYFDFEPYLRIQRKALKERLLDGQA
jgi:predicted nucleotidyltransferase